MDNFELVDNELNTASNTGRIHSNLIRLRESSFAKIADKWNNFRISRLEKKLEKANNELYVEENRGLAPNETYAELEKSILDKKAVIRRLEEKIDILSRDNVPTKYVGNRAIKLKKDMNENVRLNGKTAYSISTNEVIPKEEVIDNSLSDYGFTDFTDTGFSMAAAADINPKGEEENSGETISREEIEKVINASFENANQENKEETIESSNEKETIESNDEEVIENDVNENTNVEVPTEEDEIDIPVSIETAEEEPNYKVSSSESTPAKIRNFDEEGELIGKDSLEVPVDDVVETPTIETAKYETVGEPTEVGIGDSTDNYKQVSDIYNPMSDEALAAARENIEFDKYEDKYANDEAVRDEVVVIPERETKLMAENKNDENKIEEYIVVDDNTDDDDKDIHWDYSDATMNDLNNAVKVETSYSGLDAMRRRIKELEEKSKRADEALAKAMEQLDEAKEKENQVAEQLVQSNIEYNNISKIYNAKCEAFEDNVAIQTGKAQEINKNVDNINNNINENLKKINKNASEIEAIKSMLGDVITDPNKIRVIDDEDVKKR